MKMRVSLVALLSLALLGAYVHAQFGQQAAKLDLVKVRDDLYRHPQRFRPRQHHCAGHQRRRRARRRQVRDRLTRTSWRS